MYKLQKALLPNGTFSDPIAVIRLSDNAVIPFDIGNTDYQTYLKWVNEGNEPLPADEVK